MDSRDPQVMRLVGLRCPACDGAISPDGIRPVAEREGLAFVELRCPHCRTRTIGLLTPIDGGDRELQLDLARYGEFDATDEVRFMGSRALAAGDVDAMRAFLAGWQGDIRGLLGPAGQIDEAAPGR